MKVFVSYSRKDAEFVARIQRDLTALGYDVWVDTEDILAGGQARWRRSIVAAIRDSEVMVLVLSPNSTHSENVERELSVAADNSKRVVPIVYQQTELPDGFHTTSPVCSTSTSRRPSSTKVCAGWRPTSGRCRPCLRRSQR